MPPYLRFRAVLFTTLAIWAMFLPIARGVCSVTRLIKTTRSAIVGFGPPGKFRPGPSAWANVDILSLPNGEVQLKNERCYQCNKNGGWNKIPKFLGKHYKLFTVLAGPSGANTICKGKEGTLATVYNTRINNIMADVMEMNSVYVALIGFSDTEEEDSWIWRSGLNYSSTGQVTSRTSGVDFVPGVNDAIPEDIKYTGFTNWYKGQPNDYGPGEDYCVMTTYKGAFGKWYDIGPPNPVSPIVLDRLSGEPMRPVRVPFWCEIEKANDRVLSSVKLVNGNKPGAGLLTVEIEPGIWSGVCYDHFSVEAANIVCNMMGLGLGGQFDLYNDVLQYPIEIGNVVCEGDEESILDCSHTDQDVSCHTAVWITCYEKCPVGTFESEDNGCEKCPLGHFNPLEGTKECAVCDIGHYQDEEGQMSCKTCPQDTTTAYPGSTSVTLHCIPLTSSDVCGRRRVDLNMARIIGGAQALKGEFPWQVTINILGTIACGGTIIDRETIITAAHCLHKPSSKSQPICHSTRTLSQLRAVVQQDNIVLNGINIRSNSKPCRWFAVQDLSVTAGRSDRLEDTEDVQERNVTKMYVSDRYVYVYTVAQHNDVAVLKLDNPLQFNDLVSAACLPDSSTQIKDWTLLTISGFGVTQFRDLKLSRHLMKANVPYINLEACNFFMDDHVSLNMMCAGYIRGGVDSCQGDSGGPIAIDTQEFSEPDEDMVYYTIVGIVSWGVACAQRNSFGVYTDLRKFIDFIEDARNQKIDPIS